jgi:hypothetical protein
VPLASMWVFSANLLHPLNKVSQPAFLWSCTLLAPLARQDRCLHYMASDLDLELRR